MIPSLAEARAPADPVGPSPPRRARSVRRTSSIDTVWPEGIGRPMLMHGRARDIFTAQPAGPMRVLGEDEIRILVSPAREILSVEAGRREAEVRQLVGEKGGGYLRGVLARLLPDEVAAGSPLNLLLDDLSGASLVAGWAWSRWLPDWQVRLRDQAAAPGERLRRMEGICAGFRPGASSLDGEHGVPQSSAAVVPLPRGDDPDGWHLLDAQADGIGMRRARRIDLWLEEDEVVRLDVGFQDSATDPAGGANRIAVHEYRLRATADLATLTLASVTAEPRVLPYRECPAAAANIGALIGTPLAGLRTAVPRTLAGTVGCTHLNDVLRSLADVPQLVAALRAELRETA